jgi:hypothetical protein
VKIHVTLNRIPGAWSSPRSWGLLAAVAVYLGLAWLFLPGEGGAQFAGVRLPSCPLKTLTGIPCPFCGLTTGSAYAVRGGWRQAWDSNILSPMLASFAFALAAYTVVFRLASGRELRMEVSRPGDWPWILFATLAAVSWIANLLRR